jgi:hypothetical protein
MAINGRASEREQKLQTRLISSIIIMESDSGSGTEQRSFMDNIARLGRIARRLMRTLHSDENEAECNDADRGEVL